MGFCHELRSNTYLPLLATEGTQEYQTLSHQPPTARPQQDIYRTLRPLRILIALVFQPLCAEIPWCVTPQAVFYGHYALIFQNPLSVTTFFRIFARKMLKRC